MCDDGIFGCSCDNSRFSLVFSFDNSYLFFIAPLVWGFSQIHKNVSYIILGENLSIQGTSISSVNKIIDIKTVWKISRCSNFLATGTDRATAPGNKALEIFYNKYETIKVSPKNESDFIKDLLEINPNIQVIV
ncbi:PH domain-containing protein [Capnocytophaga canimorsus]|uniref:PH domain-containing protein n=1 Tax=Capnocytophaga canimorsus TaxID=28188 RepID=UPI001ACAD745|nr:PH domain-containing protein [Capnocytophaga canimorsus]GIM58587.1 hypothetical protein CAPN007_07940 [Capnocytophaga canimorsus]